MTTPTSTRPVPTVDNHARREALRAWLSEAEVDSRELRAAGFAEGARFADRQELVVALRGDYQAVRQLRAQSVNINAGGGYLQHANFEDSLEIALLFYDSFRAFATVDRVETGGATHHPTVNDTNQIGTIVPENAQPNSNDIVGFGDVAFRPSKFSSQFLLLPNEWVEDAASNLDIWLGTLIGQRIGRIQTQYWTNNVLIPQATKGATAASPTALVGDDLLALEYAVDPAYRMSDFCGYMMHNSIRKIAAELKDGQGRYLFRRRRKPGGVDMLNGYPILYNPNLPSTIVSGAQSVFFGAWDRIHIRDVRETRITRLTERFADFDQIATCGLLRSDMVLMDAGTGPVKYLVH